MTVTIAQGVQAFLQLGFDFSGYLQGKKMDNVDKLFTPGSENEFSGENVNYDSKYRRKVEWQDNPNYNPEDPGNEAKKIKKVTKVNEGIVDGPSVEESAGEGKADADPLNDEDKNPCIEHAYLHKTMMQGGGIEVEIIQEPDARYGKCYERQKIRQKREKLREFRFDFCVDQPSLKSSVQGRSGKRIFGN